MTDEVIWIDGTELVLEASGGSISDDAFAAANDDDRQPADDAGYPFGRFEFDGASGGFSAAPTAGAFIAIFEQTINSNSVNSPDPDANNEAGFLCSIQVDPADTQQYWVTDPVPLHVGGGKYWLKWVDGGTGVASLDSGWDLRLIPMTYGPAPAP